MREETAVTVAAQINPAHYQAGGLEVIDVIEAYGLTYHPGNAVKYILRAGRKPGADAVTDLEKAIWYVRRALQKPEVWRTTRHVEGNHCGPWFVPHGTPMPETIVVAFDISPCLGIGLAGVLSNVMHQGEIMDRPLKSLDDALVAEIKALGGAA